MFQRNSTDLLWNIMAVLNLKQPKKRKEKSSMPFYWHERSEGIIVAYHLSYRLNNL